VKGSRRRPSGPSRRSRRSRRSIPRPRSRPISRHGSVVTYGRFDFTDDLRPLRSDAPPEKLPRENEHCRELKARGVSNRNVPSFDDIITDKLPDARRVPQSASNDHSLRSRPVFILAAIDLADAAALHVYVQMTCKRARCFSDDRAWNVERDFGRISRRETETLRKRDVISFFQPTSPSIRSIHSRDQLGFNRSTSGCCFTDDLPSLRTDTSWRVRDYEDTAISTRYHRGVRGD